MAQVRQEINQAEGAAITHRAVDKCLASKKKATTPIGKESPKTLIHTNGQIILGGWSKTGTKVGMPLNKMIMTMIDVICID